MKLQIIINKKTYRRLKKEGKQENCLPSKIAKKAVEGYLCVMLGDERKDD